MEDGMEDLYSIHPGIIRGGGAMTALLGASVYGRQAPKISNVSGSGSGGGGTSSVSRASDLTEMIKVQIATHPRYPALIAAYIECRKVGAPPEVSTLMEEIGRENYSSSAISEIGLDPELDDFMEYYCKLLIRYKEELSKPFKEAASFLSDIETQLTNLCKSSATSPSTTSCVSGTAISVAATGSSPSDELVGSSEDDISCGNVASLEGRECGAQLGDNELKEMLLKKYSGYLSTLRKEFLKKRKKGKLPKDARMALLDWWNSHYRWPYPTEEEKAKLAEKTGLDQKQINNWFINQRKRHWKPSEDMRFTLMEGVAGGSSGTMLYFGTGTVGP